MARKKSLGFPKIFHLERLIDQGCSIEETISSILEAQPPTVDCLFSHVPPRVMKLVELVGKKAGLPLSNVVRYITKAGVGALWNHLPLDGRRLIAVPKSEMTRLEERAVLHNPPLCIGSELNMLFQNQWWEVFRKDKHMIESLDVWLSMREPTIALAALFAGLLQSDEWVPVSEFRYLEVRLLEFCGYVEARLECDLEACPCNRYGGKCLAISR